MYCILKIKIYLKNKKFPKLLIIFYVFTKFEHRITDKYLSPNVQIDIYFV